MKCIKARYILSIAATFGMLVSYCSLSSVQMSGGTTTETTNGCIIGSLKKINGSPASQTIVKLIKSDYDPVKDGPVPDSLVDTTGEAGEFAFHLSGGGTFNIEGVQRSSGEGILIAGVMVKDSDTTTIPPVTIRKTGFIKILLPPNIDTAGAYIYIRGTTMCAMLDDTSVFALLESVPAGVIPSVYYAVRTSAASPKTIADSVSVAPGVTTVIGYQMGSHSAKLVLNTTASGAGIAGTVTNFPVLIRLREGNFDFAQAKADGGDLRFTKSNGAFLPYEIERWDPVSKLAEIWVKVDTVYGSDSAHFVIMYWGNPNATGSSNGESVFDTADGFQGVWHMGQTGNTTAFDATVNRYDGTPSGMNASSSVEGAIGGAQRFDGASSYISLPGTASGKLSFSQNGAYTLSAWVYTEVIDSQAHYIISKSNKNYNLDLSAYNLWEIYSINNGVGWESNFTLPQLQQWKYLTGVRNGSDQRIYVDGVCVDSTIIITTGVTVRDSTFDVQIGKRAESAYGYWNGMIDEVNIANVSRSADWIKLCYMNQNKNDMLVRFK